MAVYANVAPVGTWNYAGRPERRRVVCPFALSLAVRMAHAQMGRATPLPAGHPRRLHEGAPDRARRDPAFGRAAAGAALLAVTVAACSRRRIALLDGAVRLHARVRTSRPGTASGGASRTPSPSSGGTGRSSATAKADAPSAKATSTASRRRPPGRRRDAPGRHARPPGQPRRPRRPEATTATHDRLAPTPERDADTPRVTHHPAAAPTAIPGRRAPDRRRRHGRPAGRHAVRLRRRGDPGRPLQPRLPQAPARRRRAEANSRPSAPTHTNVH